MRIMKYINTHMQGSVGTQRTVQLDTIWHMKKNLHKDIWI